jgi:hypothetical protein
VNHIWSVLYEHRFTIGGVAWYVASAFIVTMPDKDKPYDLYDHLFDFFHQMLNIKPIAGLSAK